MKRTWENYECTFNTVNTSNTLPDSKYFVTTNAIIRAAFVNMGPGRPMNQSISRNQAVCYLRPNSALLGAVMQQGDDSQITVVLAIRDMIRVKVNGIDNFTVGDCTRVPRNGLLTFDFRNNNGTLSHIHIGHAVTNLVPGAVGQHQFVDAQNALNTVHSQVLAKRSVMAQVRARI